MAIKVKAIFCILTACIIFNISAQNHEWSYRIGSSSATGDVARNAVTDASGNFYVTGSFSGTMDLDPGAGTTNITSAGGEDAFLAKYSDEGALLWGFRFGGSLTDAASSVFVDGSHVYITGKYQGGFIDVDPGSGSTMLPTAAGSTDIFISKYTTAGELVWAKGIGGTSTDEGLAITVDGSGNVYTTGFFAGTNVDFNPDATQQALRSATDLDIFILKLDATGNFVYANCMGGTSSDKGYAIAADASSNIYVTGQFFATVDFNPDAGVTNNLIEFFSGDAYLAKYDASGNYLWAFSIENSNGPDLGNSLIVDGSHVIVAGSFQSSIPADFDPGAATQGSVSNGSFPDIFFAKYTSTGSYVYHKIVGSGGTDRPFAMVKDAAGAIYMTGSFNGTADFNPGTGTANLTSTAEDIFAAKYDNNGNYGWAFNLGGSGADQGLGIGLNSIGSFYLAGSFQNTVDFDPGSGTQEVTSAGGKDVFIAKYCIPATIDVQPAGQMACIGEDATFSVTASGPGTITYTWKKGATTLSNGGRISGAASAGLTIGDVIAGDAGTYTVDVWNGCGVPVVSSLASLTVNSPAAITVQPSAANTSLCAGAPFDLSVTATGTAPLTYQWKRGTTNVGDGDNTLSIPAVSAADAGSYTVQVTGVCGPVAVSSAVAVSVRSAAVVNVQPADQSICPGDDAVFSVTASGQGTITYKWKKDGADLNNGGRITGATTATLTISDAVAGDAASYTVEVSNGCAPAANSSPADLTLNTPVAITVQPSPASTTICAGSSFNLSVTATGTGPLAYQWKRGTTNVGNGTNTLFISAVSAGDAGSYTVQVTGVCGTPQTSDAVALSVNTPAAISVQPSDQTKCLGEDAAFSVTASGPGTIAYKWKKNGSILSNGGRITGASSATLTIADALAADAASYTVEVGNGCGTPVNSSPADLTVNAPAVITSQPSATTTSLCTGSPFELSVAATGTGPLTYQWKRGTTNVGDGENTFNITSISAADAGSYTVQVTGLCGPAAVSNAVVISVSTCTGVKDPMNDLIKVYPNPSQGKFILDISPVNERYVDLTISDLNGTEVRSAVYANFGGTIKEEIDLGKLTPGMYMLKIKVGENVSFRKLVIGR